MPLWIRYENNGSKSNYFKHGNKRLKYYDFMNKNNKPLWICKISILFNSTEFFYLKFKNITIFISN